MLSNLYLFLESIKVCLLFLNTKLMSELEILAPVRVTFSHGVAATSIRSFGRRRERTDDGSFAAYSEASATGEMQNHFTAKSDAETQGFAENIVDLTDSVNVKKKKEYQEPWVMIDGHS